MLRQFLVWGGSGGHSCSCLHRAQSYFLCEASFLRHRKVMAMQTAGYWVGVEVPIRGPLGNS